MMLSVCSAQLKMACHIALAAKYYSWPYETPILTGQRGRHLSMNSALLTHTIAGLRLTAKLDWIEADCETTLNRTQVKMKILK